MRYSVLFYILGCVLFTTVSGYAQEANVNKPTATHKMYVRLGVGYGFAHAGQTNILPATTGSTIYFNGTSASAGGASESYSVKRGSFGTGGAVAIAGGYMITKNIGLELGVEAIVLPKKYEFTSVSLSGSSYSAKYTSNANLPVYVMPAVLLTTAGNGLKVYSRTGLALPVADKINIKVDYGDNSTNTIEYELTQRFSIGFQGALGLSYPIAANMRIWTEADGIFRNAYAKRLEVTSAVVNGANVLPTLTTNDKVTEFEYNTVPSGTITPNPSTARKELTSASPYSSIGVKAGIMLAF